MANFSLEDLHNLPQSTETWYLAVRRLRTWIAPEGEIPQRPYLTIVASAHTGVIHGHTLGEQPTPDQTRHALFSAIAQPPENMDLEPQRPARIFFEDRGLLKALTTDLHAVGVQAKYRDRSELIDMLVADLEEHMRGGMPEIPGLLSQSKISPKIASEFFTAAADFYRAAPWVQLSNEDLLSVRVGDQSKPYFVTVLGQGGVEYGLALYKDWEHVLQMYQPQERLSERIPSEGTNSLLYESITALPFDDLEAIERYNWEIAGPQAYPVPLHFLPSEEEVRRPDRDELLWYTAALRAIPMFTKNHLERDDLGEILPVQTRLSVPGPTGALPVEITYPAGDLPKALDRYEPFEIDDEFDEEFAPPFDRRAMEGSMLNMFGMFSEPAVSPEVQEAQELMYQAWEETNPAKRISLARKALKISADCADAYVLLAEEQADTLERALNDYQEGVAAGRRALGEAYFEENEGHFWGLLETRPFMRAMEGLALCLWRSGRKEESLRTYQELLRLNPGDNQGIRYVLADLLQEVNRLEQLAALLEEYPDDWSAVWQYTRALLAFREQGASAKSDQALRDALEQNPHVPAYLTGHKRVPVVPPTMIGIGDEAEAASYAGDHLNYWRRTAGAVEWLQNHLDAIEARKQVVVEKTGFKLGDVVEVKKGSSDPDFGTDLTGWQGRIKEFDVEEDIKQILLLIEWDSQTLREMTDDTIEQSVEEGLDWTEMYLSADEVVLAESRDDPHDRHEIIWERSQQFEWVILGEQGRRIQAVLEGLSPEDQLSQFKAWERFLQKRLTFPFEAVIAEPQESGPLKVEDKVTVVRLEGLDDFYGVLVQVSKEGYDDLVPLYDLEVEQEDMPQYQPIDDYLTWIMSR